MRVDLETLRALRVALLEVPLVVDALQAGDSTGDAAVDWMGRLEQLLAAKRHPLAAEVAVQRGAIVAARRGAIREGIAVLGRPSRSRLIVATASAALEQTVRTVTEALRPDENRFDEAERVAMQLLAVAGAKGVFPDAGMARREAVLLWAETVSSDPDLVAGMVNLYALVGRADALRLLASRAP